MPTVFVLELVSTGYFGDAIPESFRREGRAMLNAVLADLRRLPHVTVETVSEHAGVNESLLQHVANHRAEVALIIAPEFDGLLAQFCEAASHPGVVSLNCTLETIRLCADKWELAQHLTSQGIDTIPTELKSLSEDPPEFPFVIKPRDGAGSWLVRTIREHADWKNALNEYCHADRNNALFQPLILGQALSVGVLMRHGSPPELLPIATQRLSDEGAFRYLGGEIPAKLSPQIEHDVQRMVMSVVQSLPGLHGYIGCDVIVPHDGGLPLLVELNPRLTTSYLGYQALCGENLMERLLFPDHYTEPIRWKPGTVIFDSEVTSR